MKKISEIITEYGWPGISLVGEDACEAAWLIIQHAVLEPQLQELCVGLLEKAVKEKEALPRMYALLLDRVLVHKGQKQVYGSQHFIDGKGKYVPYPIDGPDNVDKRRKQAGLEPLTKRTNEMNTELKRSIKK